MNYYYSINFADGRRYACKGTYAFRLERYLHSPKIQKVEGNWFKINPRDFINLNQAISIVLVENVEPLSETEDIRNEPHKF